MSAKYRRTRVHSSIDKLPREARDKLHELLSDPYNGVTYKQMSGTIEAMCGVKLSISAISRYAERYKREAQQTELVLRRMRTIADYTREHDLSEANTYINALIQDGLMRRILDGQDDISEIPIKDAMRLGIQAQRAASYEYKCRDGRITREEADSEREMQERLEWLRGVLRDNPELLAQMEDTIGDGEEVVRTPGDDREGAGVPATDP